VVNWTELRDNYLIRDACTTWHRCEKPEGT